MVELRLRKKVDKEFEVQKIYVHKRSPYARVLLKCTTAVWGSGPSYVFSMLYSTGTTIPEEIVIDKPDGSDKAMPWTLELYMVVSKKSHNPRFNILRVPMRNSELVNNVCDIAVVPSVCGKPAKGGLAKGWVVPTCNCKNMTQQNSSNQQDHCVIITCCITCSITYSFSGVRK